MLSQDCPFWKATGHLVGHSEDQEKTSDPQFCHVALPPHLPQRRIKEFSATHGSEGFAVTVSSLKVPTDNLWKEKKLRCNHEVKVRLDSFEDGGKVLCRLVILTSPLL